MRYTIPEEDWNELIQLSREAQNTPVMALSVGDGLAGRDFASMARDRVQSKWNAIGLILGFDASSVRPIDEKNRIIEATPIK